MKTIQELTDWLINEHKYVAYDTKFEYPYTFKTSLSRRVKSKSVCDCNDKLSVYVTASQLNLSDRLYDTIDVSITAEKNGKWWKLLSYSLNKEEVIKDLVSIEETLIKMFNQI